MDLNIQRINYVSTDDTDLLNRLTVVAIEQWHEEAVLYDTEFIGVKPLVPQQFSARFKFRGKKSNDPQHHNRGQFIMGNTRVNSYVNVDIDDPIIEAEDLDEGDVDLTMFDEIAASVRENTRLIIEKMDLRAFRLGVLAARTAAVTNIHLGGNVVERTAASVALAYPLSSTGAANLKLDVSTAARIMDEDNVPKSRRLYLTPYIAQVAGYDATLFSRDYTTPEAARYAERYLGMMEGFKVFTTVSHLPTTNITTDLSKYNGNFSLGASSQRQPVMLALASDGSERVAIGKVEKRPLQVKVFQADDYDAIRTMARIHNGMGVVWPPAACEIGVASS